MGREIGLDVMEHVEVGSTLSVLELVHNLPLEIGCVGNVKPVAEQNYNYAEIQCNKQYYEHSTEIIMLLCKIT